LRRPLAGALLLGLGLRLLVMAACDRVVVDVERYHKMAQHLLDVSWNPYTTERLYPYPPPWAAVEAAAGVLDRHGLVPFAIAVKLPVLAADLLIVVLLALAARRGAASPGAPWLYAVHPVALLIGFAHGQFDALALALVLLSLEWLARGRRDASALALAGAVAFKAFPVLMLPFLAAEGDARARAVVRYVLLVTVPVAVLLLPFAVADAAALRRELVAYSGIADFGWTGFLRGARWLATSLLPRSEARYWPVASLASKVLFLAAWLALVLAAWSERLRPTAEQACLAVVLAFLALYGLLSAQYLLWAVPLGLLRPGRLGAWYAAAATAGLLGFYLFLAPGVLLPDPLVAESRGLAGLLWVLGVGATLAVAAAWLADTVRRARVGLRAATEAR